jgi:Ca2+-binding RTX toxin-like protein
VRQIYVVDLTPTAGSGPLTPGPVHQVTFSGANYDPTWANYADNNGVSLQGPHDIAYSVEQGGKRYLDVAEVGSADGPEVADPFHDPAAIRTFPLTGDPGGDTAPNWSPIGFNVVYATTAGGANEDIYGLGKRFAPASPIPWQGPAMRLTTDPARDTNPDWEPFEQCSVMGPRPPIPAPTRTANGRAQGGGPGANGNSGDDGGGGPSGGGPSGGGKRPGCTIQGGPSNDVLRGTRGRDVICGGGGNDRIIGGRGNDVINGGPGNDRILGGNDDDRLIGGTGRDRISGGRGKDSIAAKDRGRDVVSGGLGSDVARLDKKRDRVRSVERKLW